MLVRNVASVWQTIHRQAANVSAVSMSTSLGILEAEVLQLVPADRSHRLERLIASLDLDPEWTPRGHIFSDQDIANNDRGLFEKLTMRPTILRTIQFAVLLFSGLHAVGQTPDPEKLYVEWPVSSSALACETIAVHPELDDLARRHQLTGTTGLLVRVNDDGKLSEPKLVASSGPNRAHKTLDRLALGRIVKCQAKDISTRSLFLEVQWNFETGRGAHIIASPGSLEEMVPPQAETGQCAKPKYPTESLQNKESGEVKLQFLVDEHGTARRGKVIQTSGSPRLDKAAEDSFAECKFRPATFRGKSVQAWIDITYSWQLH